METQTWHAGFFLLNFVTNDKFDKLDKLVGSGVSICLDLILIETIDLNTDKKLVSTVKKISTVSISWSWHIVKSWSWLVSTVETLKLTSKTSEPIGSVEEVVK